MCGSLGKYYHGFLLLASCASEGACASFRPPGLGIKKKITNGFQLTLFFGCDFHTVINE